jgi:hypothetical protein
VETSDVAQRDSDKKNGSFDEENETKNNEVVL